jgi:hypothetical protein
MRVGNDAQLKTQLTQRLKSLPVTAGIVLKADVMAPRKTDVFDPLQPCEESKNQTDAGWFKSTVMVESFYTICISIFVLRGLYKTRRRER